MTNAFPYVGEVVHDYLVDHLDASVKVATKVPAQHQGSLVTITTVPVRGPQNLVLSLRRLTLYCWNSDEMVAGNLAETVRQLMVDARANGAAWIRNVEIIGEPARVDDPDTGKPRFQITVDVLLRALTATTT